MVCRFIVATINYRHDAADILPFYFILPLIIDAPIYASCRYDEARCSMPRRRARYLRASAMPLCHFLRHDADIICFRHAIIIFIILLSAPLCAILSRCRRDYAVMPRFVTTMSSLYFMRYCLLSSRRHYHVDITPPRYHYAACHYAGFAITDIILMRHWLFTSNMTLRF